MYLQGLLIDKNSKAFMENRNEGIMCCIGKKPTNG